MNPLHLQTINAKKSPALVQDLTSVSGSFYTPLIADTTAVGFDDSVNKGAKQPRHLWKRLFCVKTSGIALLAGRMGAPSGAPVPLFRFVNPVRSATSFDDGMAEDKPQQRSHVMFTPAQGTSVPSVLQFDSYAIRAFVDAQGEPWFCTKDVCVVLGYANNSDAIKKHCRTKGVAKRYSLTEGGQQELTFINEGNLYRLIIKSRLPAAERFEAWVCDDVLPSIRKTGRYDATPPNRITKEQYMELERFVDRWSQYFIYSKCANHAAWDLARSICGTRATEMPADKYPVVLAQFQSINKRIDKFLIHRQQFETHAIKWVFSQNEEISCLGTLRQQEFH